MTDLEAALADVKETSSRSRKARRAARRAQAAWDSLGEFTFYSVRKSRHLDLYLTADRARTCRTAARRAVERYEELQQADLRARALLCGRCQRVLQSASNLRGPRDEVLCYPCCSEATQAYRANLPSWYVG